MRMRSKKWVKPELDACPYYRDEPAECRGRWAAQFKAQQPIWLELGCGKAVSTAQMAYEHPQINFLAVDVASVILGVARRNIQARYGDKPVNNIVLTHFDVFWLDRFMSPPDQADRIIISFCNPWSKRKGQFKRRLTHPHQLMLYRKILRPGGEIYFKTDDDALFDASREYFAACGFAEKYMTRDLHASGFSPNYVSEHERLFSQQGVPIKFLIAQMVDLPENAE